MEVSFKVSQESGGSAASVVSYRVRSTKHTCHTSLDQTRFGKKE